MGRGDARVEGDVERARERVVDAGGLFILGTERHESRRIDNQLRGRSGRQGDPGESRFYLSAEDDLVRLFAGDRIYRILDRLGGTTEDGEEEPIEAGMLTKQIENAQKKVEEQNFLIRKRVLEYDDVMNQQRDVIYEYRDRILEGEDISETAREQVARPSSASCRSTSRATSSRRGTSRACSPSSSRCTPALRPRTSTPTRWSARSSWRTSRRTWSSAYDEREQELGAELMRALERFVLLQIIDERWREHLHDMDYLREGIHLRGFAQIDPLVAYKNEGFEMFTGLMNSIWEEFARYIFHVEVEVDARRGAAARARRRHARGARVRGRHGGGPAERRRRRRRQGPASDESPPAWSARRAAALSTVEPRRVGARGSGATTRARAARGRSTRSAMAHSAWHR